MQLAYRCEYCECLISSGCMPRSAYDELWREPGNRAWKGIKDRASKGECRGCVTACTFLSMVSLCTLLGKTSILHNRDFLSTYNYHDSSAYDLLYRVSIRNKFIGKYCGDRFFLFRKGIRGEEEE